MRNKEVDKYIEETFGKPQNDKSFIKDGMVYTPICKGLWRVDKLLNTMNVWLEK